MRGRTLILFVIALLLAGGTAALVRSWLTQRPVVAAAPPAPPPTPKTSVLVAVGAIARGQILKPSDLRWQPWPQAATTGGYIVQGSQPGKSFAGWVAREPFAAGEPIIKAKIVAPGDRGFLAAVLHTGMRAVSIAVTATSDISGFVFPGDRVDILITLPVPTDGSGANANAYQHKAAETVLRDVRVIAVDQQLDAKTGQAVLARTVTLEVTPKQSEAIAVADDIGKLSLSLRGLDAAPREEPAAALREEPLAAPRERPVAATREELVDGTPAVSAADSSADRARGSFTLDSDVSQLVPKPFRSKQNPDDGMVTILRGNGNNGTSVASQPASRGS
jgi:pilus assembly protein CpaB